MLNAIVCGVPQTVYMCAIISPSPDIAFMLAIAWTALNLLVSDFMQLFRDYSLHWMSYLRYVSVLYYAFQGLVAIELKDRMFDCSHGSGVEALGLYPRK